MKENEYQYAVRKVNEKKSWDEEAKDRKKSGLKVGTKLSKVEWDFKGQTETRLVEEEGVRQKPLRIYRRILRIDRESSDQKIRKKFWEVHDKLHKVGEKKFPYEQVWRYLDEIEEGKIPVPSYHYFVLGGDILRSGYTTGYPESRLRSLQNGSSEQWYLLGFVPGTKEDEKKFQERFKHLHVPGLPGDHFYYTQELRRCIDEQLKL